MVIITAAAVGTLVGTNVNIANQNEVLDGISDIVSEQDRQRKQVNLSTVEFVKSFNNLVGETHDTLVLLNRSVSNEGVLQTTVSMLQLDAAQSTENERTMFYTLDNILNATRNNTEAIERALVLLNNSLSK